MNASPASHCDTAASIVAHWIDGRAASGDAGRRQPIFDPATGDSSREVLMASAHDVDAAVASAKQAFASWADTPPVRRARILNRFLGLLNEHRDQLAAVITSEHGKVFEDARGE